MPLTGMHWSWKLLTSVSLCRAYLQLGRLSIAVGSETSWHPLSASWSPGYDFAASCIPRLGSASQDVWQPVVCTPSGSCSVGWCRLCLWFLWHCLQCRRHRRQGSAWWGGVWGHYWASPTWCQWSSQWHCNQWGPVCIAWPWCLLTQSPHPPRGTLVQDSLLRYIWQVTDAPRLEGNCVGLEWGNGRGFV
jgi:hypothetical protein